MKRRQFLKILALGVIVLGRLSESMAQDINLLVYHKKAGINDSDIKDYLTKMKNFNKHYREDIMVSESEYPVFKSTVERLWRLQSVVGHGNFQLISFDESLRYAENYSDIGPFTKEETQFIEKIFYTEAVQYGFKGDKTMLKLTDGVDSRKAVKVPDSGNYILKGESLETYEKIKKQVKENVILTSGIRGIMKQLFLFLNKAYKNAGNLSLASRSLAPPGYSYHGNGDFDVGQVDLGSDNFTERFADTEVYHILNELGYLKLRYQTDNTLGVRFEPWHIKVV
jgi:hypothetical protein